MPAGSRRSTTSRVPGGWRFRRCAAAPSDDLGHGTHIAGLIGSSGVLSRDLYQGVAPRREVRRHQGAQGRRLGQDQRRHRRHRIRHQVPASAGARRSHQPVARPPHLYACDPRSAGAGRGTRLRGRDRGRRGGRQQATARTPTRGSSRRRNAPSALTTGAVDTNRTPVPSRRRGGRLQRARSDLVRRLRQAGFRGARLASDLEHHATRRCSR